MGFCPSFVFDIFVSKTVIEFLSSETGSLEALSKKYSEAISTKYAEVDSNVIQETAEDIARFLAEIEAGEDAVGLLNDFCRFRLYFVGHARERKLKPLFGDLLDPVKEAEIKLGETVKTFKAFVFSLRSNNEDHAPAGWLPETDENLTPFHEAFSKPVSVSDLF